MSLTSRLTLVLVFALAPSTLTPTSKAANEKASCIAAAEGGQDLRTDGKLRAAREKFVACASATCPDAIRKDCTQFLSDVEASLPSIVVTATGPDGSDLYEVRMLIDGEVVSQKLDGKAIAVDPGRHRVRVEASGGTHAEVDVVLAEGDKNRKVHIAFPREKAAVAKDAPSAERSLVAPIVVGGLGAAVIAGSLVLGFGARSEIDDMRSSCAPYCDSDALDRSRRKLLIADIGIGVGVVAIAVATYMFISTPSKPSSAAASVGARYVPAGGMLTVQAVF